MTRSEVANNIVSISESNNRRSLQIRKLLGLGVDNGYLVDLESVGGSDIVIVPEPVKTKAADALISVGVDFNVVRDQVMEAMQSAGLVDVMDLYDHMKTGLSHEIYNVLVMEAISEPVQRPNPGRQLRYAALICFEGPDAKMAAKDYLEALASAYGDENPDEFLSNRLEVKAKHCCSFLHDCQKHPLKH